MPRVKPVVAHVQAVVTMLVIVVTCFQSASAQTATAPSGASQTASSTSSSSGEELAKKLNNPVASLISVPFQSDFDFGLGANKDGFRYTATLRPVMPVTLNKDWYMISRTVLPIISQSDVIGTSSQAGLGDTVQSFFFSPSKTTPFIWVRDPLRPNCHRPLAGHAKIWHWPDDCSFEATKRLDIRNATQPYLVRRGCAQPLGRELDIPAAVLGIHNEEPLDVPRQFGVVLRLDRKGLERAYPCDGNETDALGEVARQRRRRIALLGYQSIPPGTGCGLRLSVRRCFRRLKPVLQDELLGDLLDLPVVFRDLLIQRFNFSEQRI